MKRINRRIYVENGGRWGYWSAGDSRCVRGKCGHRHTTEEAARACADRDAHGCASLLGGKCFSDRVPTFIETGLPE